MGKFSESRSDLSASPRPAPLRRIRVPILVNTHMAGRIADGLAGRDADVTRELRLMHDAGVEAVLHDCGIFPANPLARSHVFFAGIDPLRSLRLLIGKRDFDVVLCVFENTALVLTLLRFLTGFQIPIVLREVSPRGWRPRDWVLDRVMPRVDHVVGMTQAQCDIASRNWHLRRPPMLIDWSVDEEFYRPTDTRQGSYILAVGEDFSRDFPTLVAACADIECDIVLKTRHQVEIPPSMKPRVRMISDRLSGIELRELYANARVVAVPLSPTDNPGGISTILEAMAMGRPIVASDVGVPRHVVTTGVDGLIVPPGDVAAFRTALGSILADDAFARRLSTSARSTVERRFALPVVTRQMAALLRRVAGEPPWPDGTDAEG